MLHLIFNKKTAIIFVVGLALVLGFIFHSYGQSYKADLRESFTSEGYLIEGPSLIVAGVYALNLAEETGQRPPEVCFNDAFTCVENHSPNPEIKIACAPAVAAGNTHYNSVMDESTLMLGLNKFLFETQNLLTCQDKEYCLVENKLDFYNAVSSNRTLRTCLNSLNNWPTQDVQDDGGDLTFYEINSEQLTYFSAKLQGKFIDEIGQPIEGFTPEMFMRVYPGFADSDFDKVEAALGIYNYDPIEGLELEMGDTQPIHSAYDAITIDGMEMLLRNVSSRFTITITDNESVDRLIEQLE